MATDNEITTLPTSDARAGRVTCSGSGLQFLYVDIPSDVFVDTRLAGQGQSSTINNIVTVSNFCFYYGVA